MRLPWSIEHHKDTTDGSHLRGEINRTICAMEPIDCAQIVSLCPLRLVLMGLESRTNLLFTVESIDFASVDLYLHAVFCLWASNLQLICM